MIGALRNGKQNGEPGSLFGATEQTLELEFRSRNHRSRKLYTGAHLVRVKSIARRGLRASLRNLRLLTVGLPKDARLGAEENVAKQRSLVNGF